MGHFGDTFQAVTQGPERQSIHRMLLIEYTLFFLATFIRMEVFLHFQRFFFGCCWMQYAIHWRYLSFCTSILLMGLFFFRRFFWTYFSRSISGKKIWLKSSAAIEGADYENNRGFFCIDHHVHTRVVYVILNILTDDNDRLHSKFSFRLDELYWIFTCFGAEVQLGG